MLEAVGSAVLALFTSDEPSPTVPSSAPRLDPTSAALPVPTPPFTADARSAGPLLLPVTPCQGVVTQGPGLVSMMVTWDPGLVSMWFTWGPGLVRTHAAWGPGLVVPLRAWHLPSLRRPSPREDGAAS